MFRTLEVTGFFFSFIDKVTCPQQRDNSIRKDRKDSRFRRFQGFILFIFSLSFSLFFFFTVTASQIQSTE